MKVIVDITEEQKEFFLSLMKENNFLYEIEEDLEVPQWQIDETMKRRKQLWENPDLGIFFGSLKERLEKKFQ